MRQIKELSTRPTTPTTIFNDVELTKSFLLQIRTFQLYSSSHYHFAITCSQILGIHCFQKRDMATSELFIVKYYSRFMIYTQTRQTSYDVSLTELFETNHTLALVISQHVFCKIKFIIFFQLIIYANFTEKPIINLLKHNRFLPNTDYKVKIFLLFTHFLHDFQFVVFIL